MADVVCDGSGNIPVMDLVDGINSKVDRAGDTMTGPLVVPVGGAGTQVIQAGEIDTKIADAIASGEGVKLDLAGTAVVKTDDSWIKNQITAWTLFNGSATPPSIDDSYNISSVSRTSQGDFTMYFTEDMDTTDYAITAIAGDEDAVVVLLTNKTLSSCSITIQRSYTEGGVNSANIAVHVLGGKV